MFKVFSSIINGDPILDAISNNVVLLQYLWGRLRNLTQTWAWDCFLLLGLKTFDQLENHKIPSLRLTILKAQTLCISSTNEN